MMGPNYKTYLFNDGDFSVEPTHEPVDGCTVFETEQHALNSLHVRISGRIRSHERAEKKIQRMIDKRFPPTQPPGN